MKPCTFKEANCIFTKPENMSDQECQSLPARKGYTNFGSEYHPVILTCWEPDEEELQEIIRTRKVWLGIVGYNMVPVTVSGFPFRVEDGSSQ